MNGSAPKSPATGSQISVRQKLKPNFSIESIDCLVSSKPIATTISTRTTPKSPVPRRKPRSYERFPTSRPSCPTCPLRRSDPAERSHLELHDGVRQRRVAEFRAVLLAVGECPLEEVGHYLGL